MNEAHARARLAVHSGVTSGPDGFLDSIRYYEGLRPDVFRDFVQVLTTLGPSLSETDSVDRDVVAQLTGTLYFARFWGLSVDGMLRRNDLISSEDQARLDRWLTACGWALTHFLDGAPREEALSLLADLPEAGL